MALPQDIIVEPTDTKAPTLTITSPTGPIEVTDASVTITGTALDVAGTSTGAFASGVASVACSVAGTTVGATALTAKYATWSARVPLPPYVPPGGTTYTITVTCEDYEGNAATKAVTVTARDATAPQVAITQPAAGYVITDTSVTVRGTASDAGGGQKLQSGVTRVECEIGGRVFPATPDAPGNWSSWSATVTVPPAIAPTGGSYTLVARAFDAVGLSGQTSATFQARDNTPPQLDVLQPARGTSVVGTDAGATVTFQGTVKDGYDGAKLTSDVLKVECLVDNAPTAVPATLQPIPGGMSWSVSLSLAGLGAHTVTIRWADRAGNTTLREHTVAVERPQSQNKGVMTPLSYLADLLDYVTRRVKTSANAPIGQPALTAAFLQPFDVVPETVHQLRIAIEVLRRWLRPVAHWKLDETSGTTARDAGLAANHGTLQGGASGPTWVAAGRVRGALAFDGVDDQVNIGPDAGLKAIVNTFTIAFWARALATHEIDAQSVTGTAGIAGQRYVIGPDQGGTTYGSADHAGVGVSVGTNGISVYEHSDGYLPATLVHQKALAAWTHVAVVYSAGRPSLYVNGAFVKQGLQSPKAFVHARPGAIGGMVYGFFQGELDDVRIYDRALSGEAVDALARATAATAGEPLPAAAVAAEATFRQTAYLSLLKRLGTSFEEIRLARTAPADARQALAARLGITLTASATTPRKDELDQLLLDPTTVTEADLERVFGLQSTLTSGPPPAVDPLQASSVLGWQRKRLLADWKAADAAAEAPIIDPDLIGVADLVSAKAGNVAFDLWSERRSWVASELAAIRTSRTGQATPLAGLDKILVETWGATAVAELLAIAADRAAGKPVDAQLAAKRLDAQALAQLVRVRELAALPNPLILASEWDEVYAILVQVRKRQRAAAWKEVERQRNLTLEDEHFVVAPLDASAPLPRWRAAAKARQQWQDTLQARIDQERAVVDALRAAVGATEEAAFPILRDALVRAAGTDADLGDRLTKRLLIDVRDSGYRQITRVDQAIATIQELLFSLRTGRAKEQDPAVGANPAASWALTRSEQQFDREWSWMGTFATWRAAMFAYQYPENLLYPHLRDPAKMTPAFAALLEQLRAKGRLTPADARSLAAGYVAALGAHGLVARWTFEEGTGTAVADGSGVGNNAAFAAGTSAPAWSAAGRSGRGLSFDGVDDYVEIPHSTSLDVGKGNADFAVSFWIYLRRGPTTPPNWRVVIHKGSDPDRTFAIWLTPDRNRMYFAISTSANSSTGGDSVDEVPLNAWTHVVYAKVGNTLRLFFNGKPQGEVALAGNIVTNTGPLRVGWDRVTAAAGDMILDDVRVYNPSFAAAGAAPGLACFPLAGELLHTLTTFALTDELEDAGFLALQALSKRLLTPWVDPVTKALRPNTPPYLEELFYFVPMQIALQLQRSGQHLAALDWFQTVYAYNLPLAQRKIYFGLEAERNIPTSFASGSDLWVPADLNPHAIAAQRAGAYTRFTVLALVRCFLEFADAEFTRDSQESLPRARMLYLAALDLLALDEMQPVAVAPPSGVVPPNPVLETLRTHARLNLDKLRQGRNIAGLQRQNEPELAPLPAGGTGTPTALPVARPALSLRPTPYYFSVLMERAKQLVGIAQQVEAAYLAALEKRDGEAYNLLKAGHDIRLARASADLQALRVAEADLGLGLARKQRDRAQIQADSYGEWIAAGPSALENAVIRDHWAATQFRQGIAVADAAIATTQAATSAGGAVGLLTGASISASLVAAASLVRSGLTIAAEEASTRAQVASIRASQERRAQEWQLQLSLANQDGLIADQQVAIAAGQQAIARQEQAIAAIQTDNAQVVVDFLANKFTNVELYEWMSGVLGRVYSYFLQQATAMAHLAQMQLAFERQETPPGFIQVDYWEAPSEGSAAPGGRVPDRRGLTGSARLLQDLYQLDQFAFDTNKRKLQLAQTLSLASLAPAEFQRFRESGLLAFATPRVLFDQAFPGHYLRLIRRVRTSVIALVPPAQGIRATLIAGGVSRVVIANGGAFEPVVVRRNPELVALTSPNGATGLFEMDVQSEMLLPFEGMGVDTTWELRMPRAANAFDYRTIADVLVTIEYTALNSFALREQVVRTLPTRTSADRAVSIRRQFADEWYDLHNPGRTDRPMRVRFALTREDFPPNLEALRIQHLLLHFARADGSTAELPVADFRTPETPVGPARPAATLDGTISTRRSGGASWAPLLGGSPIGVWEIVLPNDDATRARFAAGTIEDILLVLTYSGETPAWV
jgi:hypothetical protein